MKKSTKPSSRRRLTVEIASGLSQRIQAAAAAGNQPVSVYVAHLLEENVPRKNSGRITAEFIRRAHELRREIKHPLTRDSADLIREAREERDARL